MDWIEGVKALICGMVTVFAVLIVISFIIEMFKYIKPSGKTKKNTAPVATKAPVTLPQVPEVNNNKEDDLELVAVITAAIAASLNTSADKLVVTSFKKVGTRNKLFR